jgi:hypothetical protein
MNRIEPLWELAQEDSLVRWTAILGVALVWLSAAWLSPAPLLALVVLSVGVYAFRRRHPLEPRDHELDVL